MGEVSEVSVTQNEIKPGNTSGAETATEQGKTSVEAVQADEREIYQRGDLVVEKKFVPSEKVIWPLRSIEISVSQKGESLRMNDLLSEEWAVVEDPYSIGPGADFPTNRIVLPQNFFMRPQDKEVAGIEKTEKSLVPDRVLRGNGETYEAHNFLALRGSLMGVLHEIGHVDDKLQLSDEERIRDSALRSTRV